MKKKEVRVQAKYVHVTLHKISNRSKDYWIEKGMTFKINVVACLVGLEENNEEEKGLHAHIVIQFSTRQQLNRKQFVEHFGTDSIHFSKPQNKHGILEVLGYASKTGNSKQTGMFTYRDVSLEADPEVYKFNYQVKSVSDGLKYFEKVIDESISSEEDIIAGVAEKKDGIGRWLRERPGHMRTLQKLEKTWKLKHRNALKRGFQFQDWVSNKDRLMKEYKDYLQGFPKVFEAKLPEYGKLTLESDYDEYTTNDMEVLRKVIGLLKNAVKYGHSRPHKSLNIYLWSRNPSFGKTRLLNFLNAKMRAYRLPNDQYYVDYRNFCYDVLVSDEAGSFLKTKEYAHLKLIFEGQDVEFNRKNRTKVIKKDNPLIVLAENISFDDLMRKRFHDRYCKEVMATRVLDLELKSRATLHFFLDKCVVGEEKFEQGLLSV